MAGKTLWLQESADGKLVATLEKPARITGRLIAVTAICTEAGVVHFTDVTDGGFFSVPIHERQP